MENEAMFTVIRSMLVLSGLSYLVFWRYRQFRVDLFRQQMFVLRDEFFDEANAGLIDFDHKAYGMLRSTMNGYIRFGHYLTFWHFLILGILNRKTLKDDTPSFEKAWLRATEELNEETKNRLNDYRKKMDTLGVKHVLLGTPEAIVLGLPLLIVASVILIAVALCILLFSRSRQTLDAVSGLRKHFKSIDDTAYMYGEQASA